jgi:hypothetical protein
MPSLNLSLDQWRLYHQQLPDGVARAARRGARSAGLRVLRLMIERTGTARPASPNGAVGAVNTGEFRQRWRVVNIEGGSRVFNDHPAAPVIDGGRRRGAKMPPLAPIVAWLQRRLGKSLEEAQAMALPVARAIKYRGLEGRQILSGPEAQAQIEAILDREVRRAIERAIANQNPGNT